MNDSECLNWLLKVFDNHDYSMLDNIAHELKQRDGESWAIGDLVEKTVLLHKLISQINERDKPVHSRWVKDRIADGQEVMLPHNDDDDNRALKEAGSANWSDGLER